MWPIRTAHFVFSLPSLRLELTAFGLGANGLLGGISPIQGSSGLMMIGDTNLLRDFSDPEELNLLGECCGAAPQDEVFWHLVLSEMKSLHKTMVGLKSEGTRKQHVSMGTWLTRSVGEYWLVSNFTMFPACMREGDWKAHVYNLSPFKEEWRKTQEFCILSVHASLQSGHNCVGECSSPTSIFYSIISSVYLAVCTCTC